MNPGFVQRALTLAQAKTELDLIDRWSTLAPHERRDYWGDSYGYKVARGA